METTDTEILKLLKTQFPVLDEHALREEIVKVGRIMEVSRGEVMMDFGDYVKFVPLLVAGSIKVVREADDRDDEIFLYFLKAGETCSMSFSCCMMNKRSDIRTTAEDDTTLVAIPIQYIDQWMMKYPSWKNFVMRSYDQRMKELVQTIDSIAFQKLDERLLQYLYQKSEATQSKTIHTTHQEIAQDMNASREAISRLLKSLEKTGKISLGRNKIELIV